MGTVIIRRTGQPPLRIKGEEVVRSASSSNNASPSYGGSVGRSQEVAVYRTESGRYVAAITNLTTWQGEHDTYDAAVFPSIKPCVGYLGSVCQPGCYRVLLKVSAKKLWRKKWTRHGKEAYQAS